MKNNNNKFLGAVTALLTASALGACSLPSWMGAAQEPALKGERFAVMEDSAKLSADPAMQAEAVDIPEESTTPSGSQNSGNFRLSGTLSKVEIVSAGDSPDDSLYLAYPPVVSDNSVYVIDGGSNVRAFDVNSLKEKWVRKNDASKRDQDLPGGGLAVAYGTLYASTGYGDVVAISEADGTQMWRKNLGAPLRRPPVVQDDKVFAATIDNQLFCLSVIDGSTLWRHSGVKENTSFYGSANTAVKGDVVVVGYSSGEVFGISNTKGSELWTELIALGSDRRSASSTLNDVTASPVIIDGIVYVGGRSGDFGAFNSANGFRIWQQKLGSVNVTPWVAGRFIFVIADNNRLVAMNRFDGRVKWISDLPKPEDVEVKSIWNGPVMAGGKLITVSSIGELLVFDAQTGQKTGQLEVPKEIFSAPAIANGNLYMLTSEAKLVQVK